MDFLTILSGAATSAYRLREVVKGTGQGNAYLDVQKNPERYMWVLMGETACMIIHSHRFLLRMYYEL